MKMVKSLLLGSAAGLVAVAGAQAADLPVKAKPVEYVKVCSLYGVGYYYMPGTDICLKLGGFVRYQFTVNPGNNVSFGPFYGTGGRRTRTESVDTAQRVRALISVDTRQQTAYGTLRTYTILGWTHDTNAAGISPSAPSVYFNRGFIQIAGFTLGKASSFFDIYPNASFSYNAGLMYVPDTGDGGQVVATYTAQFGNGFSASIGIEQSRRASIVNVGNSATAYSLGAAPTNTSLGGVGAGLSGLPDIVGNVRVDQAWGSLLAAFALHNSSAGYYTGSAASGHPGENWGWAATFGGIINLPMIAPGDRFAFQYVYSEGAVRYAALNHPNTGLLFYNGGNAGFAFAEDGVYGCVDAAGVPTDCNLAGAIGTDVQNTTAWSIAAAFEHLWTPALRTSIYGSYWEVKHNGTATALICGTQNLYQFGAANGLCNPDFSTWVIGSRTQWEPVRGWIMGVDVMYLNLNSASTDSGVLPANGAQPANAVVGDQSTWVFTFRTQRNYHP